METVNDRKLRDHYLETRRIQELFSTCVPNFFLLHYQPGELLTNPFSPSRYIQFVVEGELLLYDMPDEDSTVMIQTTYNEVNLLGEVELLDAQFTPFFVEARTDVYTLALYLEQYQQILLNDPAFLRYLCSCLAAKLNGAVASSVQMPLKKRVALSLQYADDSQCITDIGRLAKTFNVSNRQLLRVLKDFCREGILEHSQKGVYRILKKPAL